MKFAICGISHETHTFSTIYTDKKEFKKRIIAEDNKIIAEYENTKTAIGGFIDYCKNNSIEIVPIFVAMAWPSGIVREKTFQELLNTTIEKINRVKDIDSDITGLDLK